MPQINRQWLINERPIGRPVQDNDFKFIETDVRQPGPGEVLVRVDYLGFDPAQKGWMENLGDYLDPTQIGDVMRGRGIGEVIASHAPSIAVGEMVFGFLGWQDYATLPAVELEIVPNDETTSAYLSVLGSTGMTAYFGLSRIGKPFPGDTMVITGAAGATGSTVGQLGKQAGCKVIGLAGGAEKCAWLTEELGFDAAIDYKSEDIRARIKELAPLGINVLWDNVGGQLLNDLLAHIADHARVVLCGGIARYEVGQMPPGPANYFNLVPRRASMEGFIVLDYKAEFPKARKIMAPLVRDGKIKYREDVQHGLENAPKTFARLFSGNNIGKQLLKLT
jgi:NADPH-dependent curcumin reductase CurA